MKGIVAAAVLVGLLGCGGDTGIGESASARLTPHVVELRAAAASGGRAAAYEELAALRQAVSELRQGGQLSEGEAADVLAASAAVEAQLSSLTPSPSLSTPATAPTTTTGANEETTTVAGEERKPNNHEGRKPGQGKADGDNGKGNNGD
jgi:hypothetical protein